MYYIFNKDGVCICSCDFLPERGDYKARGEVAIESSKTYDTRLITLKDGAIVDNPQAKELQDTKELSEVEQAKKELINAYLTALMAGNEEGAKEVQEEYKALLTDAKTGDVDVEEDKDEE